MKHNSKITAIIATATAPLEFLVQAVYSFILRTPKDSIDQIIISINGPDKRTGDPSIQDQKQKFVLDLASLDYPIQVIRTWSRLDASRAFQLCLPLVSTDYYLLMQDDVILNDSNWLSDALELFADRKCLIMTCGRPLLRRMEAHFPNENLGIIDFFSMNMSFVMAHKDCCDNWLCYPNINSTAFEIPQSFIDYNTQNENFSFHCSYDIGKESISISEKIIEIRGAPKKDRTYNVVNLPMGSWPYYLSQNKIKVFKSKTIYHFSECSSKEDAVIDANTPGYELKILEDEIIDVDLLKYYYKHLPHRKNKLINMPEVIEFPRESKSECPRILILVCVYKKFHIVEKWMKHWYTKYNIYNSKVALVHNFDGYEPDPTDKARLLALEPDFYVPRFNRGQDMGMLQDIIENRISYFKPEYDMLFVFTDDTYPVHKDVLGKLMQVMKPDDIGEASAFIGSSSIRSNGFGIKKVVAENLIFPHTPAVTKLHCWQIEVEIPMQVLNSGFKIVGLFGSKQLVYDEDFNGGTMEGLIGEDY